MRANACSRGEQAGSRSGDRSYGNSGRCAIGAGRALLLGACLATLLACSAPPSPEAATAQRAEALARRFPIVDTHIDVPYRIELRAEDVGGPTDRGDFDYPRALRGGLDAAFMSIYIPADLADASATQAMADALITHVEELAATHPDRFALATCPDDVLTAKANGRIALPMGMENGDPIAGDLASLRRYRDKGIVYVGLTHSKSNHIADSSYDVEERWGGLSPFGRSLIPALNDLGVMIDISHLSDRASWQVLELTRAPIIASHSSLRHFTPGFQRNLDDALVRAIAANGGVVQINFGSGFLTAAAQAYGEAQRIALLRFREEHDLTPGHPDLAGFMTRYRAEHPYPRATIEDVLDHIDRAVDLAGIAHVGIGSDFDGVGDTLPEGLEDVSRYPNLVAGLLRRGYGESDIGAILGGNILRVWREVLEHATTRGNPPSCRQ